MRAVLLCIVCAQAVFAWGPAGHRTVALIAQQRLTPKTAAQVRKLLDGQTMADVSTWADEVRSLPKWKHSGPWHYVNIDDGQTYEHSVKNPQGDVLSALERYRKRLARRRNPRVERADALRFLIHFVADLHQPLHVGRESDRGGNGVKVTWFGRESNLHRVWDSDVLERRNLRDIEWAARLGQIDPAEAARWAQSSPLDWANESLALRPAIYAIGGPDLRDAYYEAALPIVQRRLAQAGVRLAAFLEAALGEAP